MNTEHPHDIKQVAKGEKVPTGYVRISKREAELLNGRTPEERADWIKERMVSMDMRFSFAGRRGKR